MRKYTQEVNRLLLQDMLSVRNLYQIFLPIQAFPEAPSTVGLRLIVKPLLMTLHISALLIFIG